MRYTDNNAIRKFYAAVICPDMMTSGPGWQILTAYYNLAKVENLKMFS